MKIAYAATILSGCAVAMFLARCGYGLPIVLPWCFAWGWFAAARFSPHPAVLDSPS